jgi:hypothetical protein
MIPEELRNESLKSTAIYTIALGKLSCSYEAFEGLSSM